jgi:Ca2+-binding RTX toxin-like protein
MPTTLRSGEVAAVGYNVGGTDSQGTTVDSIQIVLLKPVLAGTVIYITDRSWNGTAFSVSGSDGTTTYTVPSDMAAGTVISVPINGGLDLETSGEAVYIYQGVNANTPTSFLFAIEYGDGNNVFAASLVNTGLVVGQNAVAVRYDSGTYSGPSTDAFAHLHNNMTLLQNIADNTNWNGDDHGGQVANDQLDQSGPYNIAPDVSFWLAASGGGNGIVSAHVDSTVGAGTTGHNIVIRYTNDQGDMVQTFAQPRDISFDTAEGKFFIIDSNGNGGTNRILQGNISDLIGNPGNSPTLTMTVLFTSTAIGTNQNQIRDMQIDTVNNIIYFTHGSRFEKINYTTANQTSTILADFNTLNPNGTSNNFADDFVINFTTGDAYFTVHRVSAAQDGDAVTKNYLFKISGLTPASGANAFSWSGGQITTMPFNPDDNDTFHPLDMGGEAFPQERGTLEGLALSPDGNTLYFTTASILWDHDGDGGFPGDGNAATTDPLLRMGGVYSYSLVSNPNGNYNVLWQQADDGDTNSQAISEVFGPQGLLDDIEVDPITGELYFLDLTGDQLIIGGISQNPPGDEGIWRIDPNGSDLQFIQAIHNLDGLGAGSLFLNRAPTVISSTNATPGVTEPGGNPGTNSGNTALVQPFLSLDVTDVENAPNPTQQLNGATVWISNNFQSGATHQDVLTINGNTSGTVNGLTFNYNSATGGMTLTGISTFNNYEATIAMVRFHTSGDNPTNYGAATNRTISWAVSDGLNHSDPVSTTVTVTGINDAPVNTAGAAMNFTEDTTGHAGAAGVPPTAPSNAVTGISVFDVDADPATQDITVTLSVGVGTLTIRTDVVGGIEAADVISGNGTGTIVITATQDQINATLAAMSPNFTGPPVVAPAPNGLIYTPPANFNGATNLTITTNDNGFNGNDPGNSGTGTTESDQDVKVINVADVNDAPTVGGDGTEDSPTILEDTPFTNLNAPSVATLFGGQFADAIDVQANGGNPTGSTGDTLAGIAVVANGSNANGQWQYWDGDSWENIGSVSIDAAKTFTATTLIRFAPTLNYNGAAPTLTVRLIESGGPAITNGGTVDLNPAPPTTGAGSVYTSGTVTLSQSITPVNDAPVNTVGGTTIAAEDGGAVNVTGMSISDVDANPATDLVSVTLDVDHGTLAILTNVSGGITSGQIVSQDADTISILATINQINATLAAPGGLTYTPDPDYNGADTVEITTSDLGNSGQDPVPGTGDDSEERDVDSKAITVTAANDPVTTAAPTTLEVTEDATNFAVTGMSISDVDATIAPNGIYVVTLSSTNGTMSLSTLTGLTFSAGDGTSDATMTFSGTLAALNTALATATYTPTGDHNGSAEIQLQATDTFGGVVATGTGAATNDSDTIAVTIDAVNDPVTIAAPASATLNEDAVDFAVTGISISDVDSTLAPGGVYEVVLQATQGTMKLSTTTGLTFTAGDGDGDATMTFHGTRADINAALATLTYTPTGNYNGAAQIDIDVTDEYGATVATGSGAATADFASIDLTVSSVNDEPAGADKTVSTSEDDAYTFLVSDFAISDPIDGDDLAGVYITTLPAAGSGVLQLSGNAVSAGDTISVADITAGNFKFVPDADETGSPYSTFTFQVVDDGETTGGSVNNDQSANTMTINVTPDNLPPTLDLDADGPATGFASAYTEGGAAAAVSDTDVLITDADAGDNVEGATITISNAVAGDVLTVVGTLPGTITVDLSSTATNLILTGTGTQAQYEAAIEQVTFSNTGDNPTANGTNTSRTINVTVTDGDAASNVAVTTVTVSGVNDDPTINNLQGDDVGYIEGSGPQYADAGGNALVIDDSPNFHNGTLTVEITGNEVAAEDVLFFAENADYKFDANLIVYQNSVIIASWSGGNPGDPWVFTFREDATASHVSAVMALVTYENTNQINPSTAQRTLTWTLTDGDGGSDAVTSTITVTPVTDAPTSANDSVTTSEDSVYTFTVADFPFSDIDGNALSGVRITDLPNGGTMRLDGVAVTDEQVIAVADITAGKLTYTPIADGNGSPYATFQFKVIDNGTTDNGGANESGEYTMTIDVTAVNDAPVNSLGGTIGTGEDAVDAWLSGMSISDVDADPATDEMYVTFQVMNGALEIRTDVVNGIVDGDIIAEGGGAITIRATLNEINETLAANNGLTYTPNANFNGDDTLTVTTNDQGANGSDPGLTADDTSEEGVATRTISVAPVNDAPSGADKTISVSEDDTYTFTLADFGFTDPADGDEFASILVNGVPAEGDLLLNGSQVVSGQTVTAADISSGLLTFTPDPDDTGTNYGQFSFQVFDDGGTDNGGSNFDASSNTITIDVTPDEITGTSGNDTQVGTSGPDIMNGNGGDDVMYGHGGNDQMNGGSGNDYMDGGPGSDTMTGETGNDRYVVEAGDTIVEVDGEGIDIVYARTSFALMAGVSIELLATANYLGTEAIDLTGNELNNAVTGNNGNNTLKGGAGDDFLTGLDGHDFLYGGSGRDIMVGGLGNDRYFVEEANDVVREYAGEGSDIVYSTVSYTLAAGMEVEKLAALNGAGTDPINLTGNEFNNTVQGNDGANVLNGGAGDDSVIGLGGNDTIDGGAGRDILTGGTGADTFRFTSTSHSAPGAGDRITDFVSGTDKIDLSQIDANTLLSGNQAFTFIGTGAFSGTAGELRYDVVGGRMHIYGDTNGDGLVDMHIAVDGTILAGSDFIP